MIRRLFPSAALLAVVALANPASAFDPGDMTGREREAFRSEIRAYLLENPEVILEAVEAYEQRRQARQEEADAALIARNIEEIHNDGFSWIGGNPDGDVTLVEFLDYRCGYCRRAHPEIARLISSDGNIRLIVKELPILGEQSVLSSKFAISVRRLAGPDAYRATGDELMTFRGQVTIESLRRLAGDLGLDADAVIAGMDSREVVAEISANRTLARKLRIEGTPTFVLEDEMIRGYVPLEVMQEMVSSVRGG